MYDMPGPFHDLEHMTMSEYNFASHKQGMEKAMIKWVLLVSRRLWVLLNIL